MASGELTTPDPIAIGFEPTEWRPAKTLLYRDGDFSIHRSLPESDMTTMQFAIRRNGSDDDIFRLDNYDEGYIAAHWKSTVTPEHFFEVIEDFLIQSEPIRPEFDNPDDADNLMVFLEGEQPILLGFFRPATYEDLKEPELLPEDFEERITILRAETRKTAFTYQPGNWGIITYVGGDNRSVSLPLIGEYVHGLQPEIPAEIVTNLLQELPYMTHGPINPRESTEI